ncbi:TPA: RusA family crossover junction endodeoxyribonuclease [Pasteurella multocida]|nr:RusA family crossover junction endodeoxyribonuclease [Pasteurella multocida]
MAVVDYQLILELPFPPTVNTYWRRVGNSTKISEKGRKYSRDVAWLVRGKKFPKDKRACVFIEAFMPDKRERDLDNLFKALLDSLVKAGVLVDDSIIDELRIVRRKVVKNGLVRVHIGEWEDDNY